MPSAHRQGGYVPNAARLVVPLNIEKMFERPDVDQLVEAFQLVEGPDEIRAFLTDLCTPREICDFAQRLQVARYLDEGEPYVEVQARTGASSTTVSRVSKSLNGEYATARCLSSLAISSAGQHGQTIPPLAATRLRGAVSLACREGARTLVRLRGRVSFGARWCPRGRVG